MPIKRAGGGGRRSQPSMSIRNHQSMAGFQRNFCISMSLASRSSSDQSPAREAIHPAAPDICLRRSSTFARAAAASRRRRSAIEPLDEDAPFRRGRVVREAWERFV
jgi:hypothetical protein